MALPDSITDYNIIPEELKPFFGEVIPELKKKYPESFISETLLSHKKINHGNPCGMWGYYGFNFWVGEPIKIESDQFAYLVKYAIDSLAKIDPKVLYQECVDIIENRFKAQEKGVIYVNEDALTMHNRHKALVAVREGKG